MTRRGMAPSLLALVGLLAGACSSMTSSPTAPGSTESALSDRNTEATTSVSSQLALCADEVNRYRASVGRAPLARSQSLEGFAAEAAAHDATARVAHKYFRETNGAGVSRAETEILWWKNQAIADVVRKGLAQMWRVGPGGEHYDILVGAYTEIGCGIFVSGNEVTVAQEFR